MNNAEQKIEKKFTDQYFMATDGHNDIRRKHILQLAEEVLKDFIECKHNSRVEFYGRKTVATEGVYENDLKLVKEYIGQTK